MNRSDKYFILSNYPLIFWLRPCYSDTGNSGQWIGYHVFILAGKKWILTHESREFFHSEREWAEGRGLQIVAILRIAYWK